MYKNDNIEAQKYTFLCICRHIVIVKFLNLCMIVLSNINEMQYLEFCSRISVSIMIMYKNEKIENRIL